MAPELKKALAGALAPVVTRVRTDVTAVKANGKQAWTNEALTHERLLRHVNGVGPARGCCPIKEGESVTMLALFDIDSHKGEIDWPRMADTASKITDAAALLGLEAIPFRSSGGNGIHLLFIWDEPQDAYSVRQLLKGVLLSVGLRDGAGGLIKGEVEVFPKQDAVPVGGRGNQFVLPLAGASEPLSPLLDYEPMGKDAAIGMAWPVSEPVPLETKPVKAIVVSEEVVGFDVLRSALQAIPNSDAHELDYDKWRDVVFGIHAETGGSDEGLALAHEFSARSAKYDAEFLENRIWPYIRDRDGGISGRTVLALAREHGWQEDISDMFEVLPVEGGKGAVLDDMPSFQRDRQGAILATLDNVTKGAMSYSMTGWRIAYDQFKDEMMVTEDASGEDGWRPWRDVDYVELRLKLENRDFKPIGREMIRDAVLKAATDNQFDSAILWLSKLVWDGKPRVERFLSDYFGAADTDYTRAVSRYTWTALAGRVLTPGVKADMSPVLIGEQGIRKTTGVIAMAPYTDAYVEIDFSDDDDKNARKLRGKLLAETAEMKGFQKKEQNHIKSFMSRQYEVWVPKYMERTTRYARRCLFLGTGNDKEFLVDETGNRRWLPLDVTKVELEMIERDRDQLWAEAAVLYRKMGVLFKEAERLADGIHKQHMISDEWEHIIDVWLNEEEDGRKRGDTPFRLSEVAAGAVGIFSAHIDRKTELRIGKILRRLGYVKNDTWHNGRNVKMWMRKEKRDA